jgi:hypothetical protein
MISNYDHHSSRHIRLAITDSTKFLQHVNERGIVFGWLVHQRREANSTILPLNVEVVFERNRQTMQWPYSLAGFLEVLVERFGLLYRFIEEDIAETIRLYMNQYDFGT